MTQPFEHELATTSEAPPTGTSVTQLFKFEAGKQILQKSTNLFATEKF